ncbi:hypothetical protein N9M83_05335 [Candidatus Poseidonia alphae]|nr:hypothetical protein [Candidatus Poseidonia alphae]MDA8759639.1 hypothetical protein [Candidatus Poseidonia alphae]
MKHSPLFFDLRGQWATINRASPSRASPEDEATGLPHGTLRSFCSCAVGPLFSRVQMDDALFHARVES